MGTLTYLRIFLTGLCMGAADLIPGISGGTIAFIMGIYEPLIASIKSVSLKNLREKKLPWRFLSCLLSGMACSFLLFSHAINHFLNDIVLRTLLYAGFTGLIGASILFLARQMSHWQASDVFAVLASAAGAYLLSGQQFSSQNHVELSQSIVQPWLIFSGAVAISAMLLPGISGSYLLMFLGVYPLALEALTDFSSGLRNSSIDFPAFVVLCNIFAGIVLGAAVFSHVVSWLLRKHHRLTIVLLIGFMIGAMPTAWPFWDFEYIVHPFKPEKGLVPLFTNPILPDFGSPIFWKACLFAALGFSIVFVLDFSRFRIVHSKQS